MNVSVTSICVKVMIGFRIHEQVKYWKFLLLMAILQGKLGELFGFFKDIYKLFLRQYMLGGRLLTLAF